MAHHTGIVARPNTPATADRHGGHQTPAIFVENHVRHFSTALVDDMKADRKMRISSHFGADVGAICTGD